MPTHPLIPPAFAALVAGRDAEPEVTGDEWLRRLPRILDDAFARWDLSVDGDGAGVRHGVNAVVVPVSRADGSPAALKAGWPHAESTHEHLALRAWGGNGAARLLAADPATSCLLLERLDPDRPLRAERVEDACLRIGDLLARLDRPALPQVPTLSAWLDDLTERLSHPPTDGAGRPTLPRRFLDQAAALARDLRDESGLDDRLVHTDLHDENVLHRLDPGPDTAAGGSDASPWRAIDPKPLSAHPAFAMWPMLHNRWEDLADDPRWGVRCRLGWLCEPAGVDEETARAYALLRTVEGALREADTDPAADLTRQVTLLKALQPGA